MEDYDNSFNSWYDKKDIEWMSEYFPKLEPFRGKCDSWIRFI